LEEFVLLRKLNKHIEQKQDIDELCFLNLCVCFRIVNEDDFENLEFDEHA
jgi:hypothetical protein